MPETDLVILGGGSGGYACALRAAELGLTVTLIERDKLGGTCLHRGCIPTKALLHAGEVADTVRNSAAFGVEAEFGRIDLPGVRAYLDKVVNRLWKGLQGLVSARDIDYVSGHGSLSGADTVTVNGDSYRAAKAVVLATGSQPRTLPGLDIDGKRVITSDQALLLTELPASVLVLGGGVIGVEFASIWRSYGAEVSIVEALPRLLPLEDESSSKLLERALRKRGISITTGRSYTDLKRRDEGVTLTLDDGQTLDAELLLVAVGRGPVSADIGFESAGVSTDRGYVVVDNQCQTTVPGVYAIGDLRPGPQLAHLGFAEGIRVAELIAGEQPPPIDYDQIPRVTYSHPEVAAVGLSSAQATERGHEVVDYTYDLAGNGRAQILGISGAVKVVAAKDGPVLGVHMVGDRVGDLVAEAQLITNWEALPSEVARLLHPHPTMSEAIGEAHLALAGKPLHAHG
ncbi:MAG: dihydrolipoyl dehydrogenase [Microlunatus sp.]|nr:dihydrolipoyl dehydrogenase [Microlunatus sp.]MDN5770068.1 dihydrolipoyl dehydrogenase [Microlunatus sp.]